MKFLLLVRVTRLELVRHGHTPLKRACLPVPAHSRQQKRLYQTVFAVSMSDFTLFRIRK